VGAVPLANGGHCGSQTYGFCVRVLRIEQWRSISLCTRHQGTHTYNPVHGEGLLEIWHILGQLTVRETTGQDTLESVIRERRPRWFGHVYRMDSNRIARQAMDWIPSDFKKKRGRPGVSWTSTIKKDLDLLGLTWKEALDLTKDRSDWRDCTA